MSLRGWTESLVVPAVLLAGCGVMPSKAPAVTGTMTGGAAEASPAQLARYDSTVSRLGAVMTPRPSPNWRRSAPPIRTTPGP